MADPVISDQPDSTTTFSRAKTTLSVTVAGGDTVTYQWRKDGVELADGGRISGSAGRTLTIDPTGSANAGVYDVVITNDCGSATSDAATLAVVCRPDYNADGRLNINDFICFQAKWKAKDPYGDYDGGGTYTVNDFIRFQTDFASMTAAGGCLE